MKFEILRYPGRWTIAVVITGLIAICLLSSLSTLSAASSNTYYVATNGSDSNPGTVDRPFKTAQHAYNVMGCGDTTYIRGGTHNGGIGGKYGVTPFCNSWASPLTIQNYPGEIVILTNDGEDATFGFATDSWPTHRSIYMILKGVIIDETNGTPGISGCIAGAGVDYVKIIDVECRNSQRAGITPNGAFWELLNVNSHDNGLDTDPSHAREHGVYLTSGNCLIDGGSFHHNGGYGIQIYDNGSASNSNNIVRNARIYLNNLNTSSNPLIGNGGGGMVLANGSNNVIYNNIIYGNGASNLQINGSCKACAAYNNTIYGGQTGIQIVDRFAVATVIKNNIVFGVAGVLISDLGTGTVSSNNLTTNPSFTNAGIGDFTLQASSPAIDAGTDLRSIFVTDLKGGPRPTGGAFDIGAYEYGAQPPADTIPPTVSIKVTANPH